MNAHVIRMKTGCSRIMKIIGNVSVKYEISVTFAYNVLI